MNWTIPIVVPDIANAIDIVTTSSVYSTFGGARSCALLSTGLIKCWGEGGSAGNIGDGITGGTRYTPTYLASPVVDAIDVSISLTNNDSFGHACAVQSNGLVKCWGTNNNGQLGNRLQLSSAAPVTVSGITNAIRIYTAGNAYSTNYGRTCALLADGTIKCWGWLPSYGSNPVPIALTGISNAVDFSMSSDNGNDGHYCAVLATGSLMCGGAGGYGQLGNGASTTVGWVTPVSVSNIKNAVKVLTMSSGYSTTYGLSCALLADGLIKCWGSNATYGRLGDGTNTDRNTPVSVASSNGIYYTGIGAVTVDKTIPALKDGITAATNIAVGSYHACALDGGTARCWGYNAEGQLGNNSNGSSASPVGASGISNATQIAAGYMHTCAILGDKTVKCWGLNTEGQLGNGTTTSSTIPVAVTGITNAVQISAGDYHTCVTLDTGAVQCWGLNTKGQLGQ